MFEHFFIISYVVSGSSVSVVLITNYLFKHWLDTTPHIVNPVKHISQVLNYARKNKYPRNCSALTYWEEEYPSCLDLGKEKYGGPFSEEQVEDVKTVLRLIPLLISLVGVDCAKELTINSVLLPKKTSQFILCCVNKDLLYFFIAVFQTVLRLIPLLISIVGVECAGELILSDFYFQTKVHSSFFVLSTMTHYTPQQL